MANISGQILIPPGDINWVTIENEHGVIFDVRDGEKRQYQCWEPESCTWISVKINGELVRFDETLGGRCLADYGANMAEQYKALAESIGAKPLPKQKGKAQLVKMGGKLLPF
jgi:hypothetical protein